MQHRKELQARTRDQLQTLELSTSLYDTAWVAMVPALRRGGGGPRFPQCVAWIQRNQRGDGSWRHAAAAHQQLGSSPEIVTERDLSSTLACVLALARWDAGSEHVRRGIVVAR
jgi:hypothetical protein